jgi:hypothetical protein
MPNPAQPPRTVPIPFCSRASRLQNGNRNGQSTQLETIQQSNCIDGRIWVSESDGSRHQRAVAVSAFENPDFENAPEPSTR